MDRHAEPNARIHAVVTVAVITLGLRLHLPRFEWLLVAVATTVVWVAEALNTSVEALADAACPERHPGIGVAKDVAAGAVLLAAIGAAAIGSIVFLPRLWQTLQ